MGICGLTVTHIPDQRQHCQGAPGPESKGSGQSQHTERGRAQLTGHGVRVNHALSKLMLKSNCSVQHVARTAPGSLGFPVFGVAQLFVTGSYMFDSLSSLRAPNSERMNNVTHSLE